ncbi:Hypothetical predicted protein [Octopus vulgaris]|nr:Hypothetical predicted protein [Octopus vulgaris]
MKTNGSGMTVPAAGLVLSVATVAGSPYSDVGADSGVAADGGRQLSMECSRRNVIVLLENGANRDGGELTMMIR